jgi:hypothetical protein
MKTRNVKIHGFFTTCNDVTISLETVEWHFWHMFSSVPQFLRLDWTCSLFAFQVTARAKYSIAYDGTFPDLYLPNFENETVTSATGGSAKETSSAHPTKKAWKLYMPNAYHPLLLQKYQENLDRAKRDVASAAAVSLSCSKLFHLFFP